jgi:hypothetical protein
VRVRLGIGRGSPLVPLAQREHRVRGGGR